MKIHQYVNRQTNKQTNGGENKQWPIKSFEVTAIFAKKSEEAEALNVNDERRK